ncbi:VOC family protein [Psychrobacillus glaciei]|uniref:VOC family protein n=1 Tax=Psychrobacillus glaciei TaxID=2283160 RepID=A0A5J6SST1_9BACI|nr:VOC family protein [Psychrobacillus glaciei]QFG00574.1 VOC family protein [Psychrobacillus glaciei]
MYLDHIVHHVTKTPKDVVEDWCAKGFHAVVGGQHVQWGTNNALLYTKNSYIEWLALEHEAVAFQVNHPLIHLFLHDLKTGPGFGTICIRTSTIDELCLQLEEKGIETSGVLHAERKTTSGLVRKWKMLFVKEEINDVLPSPFFIEWEESDEERYQLLQDECTIDGSNLDLSITTCEFHVGKPREVIDKWKKYFDLIEQDEQTLLLLNTQLVFKKLENGTKERLGSIQIRASDIKEDIIYEQATYRFC